MVSLIILCCCSFVVFLVPTTTAWTSSSSTSNQRSRVYKTNSRCTGTSLMAAAQGSLHGQNSCFMPLKQLDQDYYAPRVIQVAGAFPGITRDEILATTSEAPPDQGQWNYDFNDPEAPPIGKVALEGSQVVHGVEDPVVIIAEHPSLNIPLPEELKDPVDLIVLVDRSKKSFGERKFLVIHTPDVGVSIGAFNSKAELPSNYEILGQVAMVQIPWLPCMAPTKSGFMEVDEYF